MRPMREPTHINKALDSTATDTLRILIVDDNEDDFVLIGRQIQTAWPLAELTHAIDETTLVHSLAHTAPDLVICDYAMPMLTHDQAIELVEEHKPGTPLILLSGLASEALGVQAMHKGVQDYVEKSKPERLIPAIRREIHTLQLKREKTELEQAHLQAMYFDSISGFLNRDGLSKVLISLIGDSHVASKLCVLSIHLVRSQTRGSEVDPRLRRNLFEKLVGRVREHFPNDILCRWSDTMLVVVSNGHNWEQPDNPHSIERLNSIESTLNHPFLIENIPVRPNLRVGLARPELDGKQAAELVTHAQSVANVLEYRALNLLAALSPSIHDQAKRRKRIELGLAKGIESGELTLDFQPIEDLKTKRVCGVEALVRWIHPELGLIMPNEFIGAAEDSGLIEALGDWVLKNAAQKLLALHQQGFEIWCSVNCSPGQLLNPDFPKKAQDTLREVGLDSKWIEFEVTEYAAIDNMKRTVEALDELRQFGCTIALDDFGTGYASLNYLRQLPVDVLKIDKSFVTDLLYDKSSHMIVKAVIDLAHALGLVVHAEGIETKEQRDALIHMGCDRLQGFWFAKPLGHHTLLAWLDKHPITTSRH